MKPNWFVIVVGVLYFCAFIQDCINHNGWRGLTWLCYGFANVCIIMGTSKVGG